MVDEVVACDVTMHDGRAINATLETHGFMLAEHPTCVSNFEDSNEVISSYYGEIMELVKRTSGASRVFVFDHTLRETGSTSLNADDSSAKAAPVPRVHCDYTATGAPKRLLQLGQDGIHSRIKDRTLTAAEVDSLAAGRFAFVNVWRSIDPVHPVLQNPLAVCDENTVPDDDRFLYELRFLDRTGENYSLQYSPAHKWYYYPNQTMDECLVFKVYDKKTDGPRFVFHTAFDDPRSQPDAPPRKSVEVRTICFFDDDDALPNGSDEAVNRPMFFDMKHSNNAARIRLWLRMDDNPHSGEIDTTMVRYDDLKTPEFAKVNPLAKVPGFIREDGTTVFESNVILQYLEDKFGPLYTPQSAEDKQLMNLQMRIHDLYIASPNCTAPGFSHSQGAMYLSTGWHGAARGITIEDRAAKFEEIYKQLVWLEAAVAGEYLSGSKVTMSDMTWFPTCTFMEFMLPKYGWGEIFDASNSSTPFPKLAQWYTLCQEMEGFRDTRAEIWEYWDEMEKKGQFEPIMREIEEAPVHLKFKFP